MVHNEGQACFTHLNVIINFTTEEVEDKSVKDERKELMKMVEKDIRYLEAYSYENERRFDESMTVSMFRITCTRFAHLRVLLNGKKMTENGFLTLYYRIVCQLEFRTFHTVKHGLIIRNF